MIATLVLFLSGFLLGAICVDTLDDIEWNREHGYDWLAREKKRVSGERCAE